MILSPFSEAEGSSNAVLYRCYYYLSPNILLVVGRLPLAGALVLFVDAYLVTGRPYKSRYSSTTVDEVMSEILLIGRHLVFCGQ